jgi:hypothetical protein
MSLCFLGLILISEGKREIEGFVFKGAGGFLGQDYSLRS